MHQILSIIKAKILPVSWGHILSGHLFDYIWSISLQLFHLTWIVKFQIINVQHKLIQHLRYLRLTHEHNIIFIEQFWQLGILRRMTPPSPYSLHLCPHRDIKNEIDIGVVVVIRSTRNWNVLISQADIFCRRKKGEKNKCILLGLWNLSIIHFCDQCCTLAAQSLHELIGMLSGIKTSNPTIQPIPVGK